MQDFVLIISGLILWVLGANWLLKGAAMLSLKFNLSKILVGATFVSLATTLPELLVSVQATTNDMPDMVLGTAIGANIANLGMVLALVIIVSGISVNKSFYAAPWSVMILAAILFFGFIYFDGEIQRYEGFFMLMALLLFLAYLILSLRNSSSDVAPKDKRPLPLYGIVLFLGLGGLAFWGGSEVLLNSMSKYGMDGTDKRIVAITTLSVLVSFPELAVAVFAMIRKQGSISFGNLVGANMLNILGILGITAMKGPLKVMDPVLLTNDILWMMGLSFFILPLLFLARRLRLDWKGGMLLLGIYLAFWYSVII